MAKRGVDSSGTAFFFTGFKGFETLLLCACLKVATLTTGTFGDKNAHTVHVLHDTDIAPIISTLCYSNDCIA